MSFRFRLATFNLENLDWSPSREDEFERRLAAFAPTMKELAADILCLQEIDAQKRGHHGDRRFVALDRLLSGGPYEAFHRSTSVKPGTDAPADVHNLAILSRWPIIERKQLYHDIVAKWSWSPPHEGETPQKPVEVCFDRPLLYACVTLPDGRPLHVINLHLRAPRAVPLYGGDSCPAASSLAFAEGQFLAAQKREGQALEARLFVERLFDAEPNARIAVCGDFNSEEHDAPARILRGARDEDAPETSPRMLIPLAARVEKDQRYSVIHDGRPTLLDHIFASPALSRQCVHVAILNAGLQDEATARDPILGSLHAPVVATFDLSG
jgi:endonuclease/exonuclease/phosphatase family metal-dependent hydrolase